jgi:hypothetical protein
MQIVHDLQTLVRERGASAYLVTVSEQGGPHAVYVPVTWDGGSFVVDAGATTVTNAAARPLVSLLYPVREDNDYSLIVDGAAVVESAGDTRCVRVRPTRAVLHRHGPSPDPTSSCGADCVPLPLLAMPVRR